MTTSPTLSTKLNQIAETAAKDESKVFTRLSYLIDEELLRAAYTLVRKDGATGVDKVTGEQYAANLDSNLKDLYQRLIEKRYRAPMIRRVRIPKADGGERALGIPTFEDKIVQKAVAMVMEPVYEQDFLNCSYGFRPNRSAHQALGALRRQCIEHNVQWILDADIKAYFDAIPHALLQEIVRKRVNDGNIIRLIGKWLHTGVADLGRIYHPETGTPQGGVISPLLANIYLHEVLDKWFEQEVKPRLKGSAFLVRYADDFVIGFEHEQDARKVHEVLPKRFEKYGLTIHPDKTRLRRYSRPTEDDHDSETFDFLGFTHYWGKSRDGHWVIKRKTAHKRLRRTLKAIWSWCKAHRHHDVQHQYTALCRKLRGHYQYFAVRCNHAAINTVNDQARKMWKYWLSRRSNDSAINWVGWQTILTRFPLPKPRILHQI
jgi:RNA-directed DNA polymerase